MKKILILFLMCLTVLSVSAQRHCRRGFYGYGYTYGYYHRAMVVREPIVREYVVERPVYVEKPVYIEKVVEKPVYIERKTTYTNECRTEYTNECNGTVLEEITDDPYYYSERNKSKVRTLNNIDAFDDNVATQWTLMFNINSANLTTASLANLHNIKKFHDTYPNCKFEILSYADRGTGYSGSNYRLSERRADRVKEYLYNKYNMQPNLFYVDCHGSYEQVYVKNDWNRCVIVRAIF